MTSAVVLRVDLLNPLENPGVLVNLCESNCEGVEIIEMFFAEIHVVSMIRSRTGFNQKVKHDFMGVIV